MTQKKEIGPPTSARFLKSVEHFMKLTITFLEQDACYVKHDISDKSKKILKLVKIPSPGQKLALVVVIEDS